MDRLCRVVGVWAQLTSCFLPLSAGSTHPRGRLRIQGLGTAAPMGGPGGRAGRALHQTELPGFLVGREMVCTPLVLMGNRSPRAQSLDQTHSTQFSALFLSH